MSEARTSPQDVSSRSMGSDEQRNGKCNSRARRVRRSRRRSVILALLATAIPSTAAQQCVSLSGSTQCPAFNRSSVSTDSDLSALYPFLAFVTSTQQFDAQLSQYVNSSYVQSRYQQLLGCDKVNLGNTTSYYARFTTSVICNAIVQNSIKPCSLSAEDSRPLCAESCAQQATSEEVITVNQQLCGSPRQNFMDQIRADFTNCALPSDSLSGGCVTAELNEPENCGYAANLQGLCAYCATSSPNATDSCCETSNISQRCPGVVLPSTTSLPPLFPSATASSSSTAAPVNSGSGSGSGLSGGQIAGIVVGSVVGAALILALLVFGCMAIRRRRRGSQGSVFNQPTPPRKGGPSMAMSPPNGTNQILPPSYGPQASGRVARMSALEAPSSESPSYGEAAGGKRFGDTSDSEGFGDTPESQKDRGAPVAGRRNGSLSSQSMLGALDDPSSPNTEGQISSPEGVTSAQSEQLPYFKDYYSQGDIHPNDKVSVLWDYQPRAGDEFELERGDMLKVVGIWDDGWATGVRIPDRADEYDPKRKMHRDSGVSDSSRRGESPPPTGEIKAFPLVCICLPEHWKAATLGDPPEG